MSDIRSPVTPEILAGALQRPRSAVACLMARTWSQVIGPEILAAEEIREDDNFFDLGGHSLHAHRHMARLGRLLDMELPPRWLYDTPTLGALADRIERSLLERWQADGTIGAEVERIDAERLDAWVQAHGDADRIAVYSGARTALPLSRAQERLWFLEQLHPGTSVYNISRSLHLRGRVDVPALRRALNAVVARHETLRAALISVDGEPVQRITSSLDLDMPVLDLRSLDESVRVRRAEMAKGWEAKQSFDLVEPPLLRACLLQLADDWCQLVITVHHLVFDGWSLGVLFDELSWLYRPGGEPATLEPLAIQFGDYVVWERQQNRVEDRADLAWWTEELRGLEPLQLSTDRPRPAVASLGGRLVRLRLGRPLTEAAERLAESQGGTLFMVLAAVWAASLARFSGQNELLVGTPVAGRDRQETEPLIAFFVNTLALRFDLMGDPTVQELLRRVRTRVLDALAHQSLPFARLVEELAPERSLSHAPLVQVTFAFQNAPLDPLELAGLDQTDLEVLDPGQTDQDLSFSLAVIEGQLRGELIYNRDLFHPTTIERLIRSFERLMRGFVRSPEERLSALPRMSAAETHQLTVEWNDTERPASEDGAATLIGLLLEQMARTPDAEALVLKDTVWTYGDLARRVDRLALRLRALGVGAESRVGICSERTGDLVVGMLAVLRAGGAYVPLDPAYPSERLSFMLEDAVGIGGVLLVGTGAREDVTPPEGLEVVPLASDDSGEDLAEAAWPQVHPETLAYLIYTSGSTGRPKGVAITHGSAAILMRWAREHFADDLGRLVASTSINFDLSVFEIFLPLCWGGRVVLIDDALHLDDASEPRLLNTVPSAMRELVRSGPLPPSLRTVNLAGEPLRRDLVEAIYAAGRVERVFNLYGPSEDTTYSTGTWVRSGGREVTIGRPVANTRALVLDRHLQPSPIGVPGHLLLGGDNLARGYWRRPALTAASFVPDPSPEHAGERLYRTGDLVRWRADGEMDFLGRIDHQVKIRGFRIELGEIETRLLEHADVREVVVVAREDRPGDKRLVAYAAAEAGVRVEDGMDGLRERLRVHLSERLPAYMVPSHILVLAELPHTPNGKIDRKALPRPGQDRTTAHVPPETLAERLLAALWGQLFSVDEVGAADRFFDLGGHSLDAHRHMARLRQLLSTDLPVRTLYESSTLSDLAVRLEETLHADLGLEQAEQRLRRALAGASRETIERRLPGAEAPASFAQERLWFLEQLDSSRGLYNVPVSLRLSGPLDEQALETALHALAARHEILRVALVEDAGRPRQRFAPDPRVDLTLDDLRTLPHAERGDELEQRRQDEAARPFDLSSAPLWRVRWLRLEEEASVLLLTFHHLIFDGWSIGVLLRDLNLAYAAAVGSQEATFSDLPVQYGDFAAWERQRGEAWSSDIAFWRERLAGDLAPLDLPFDRPRPLVRTYGASLRRLALGSEVIHGLRGLAESRDVSLFMTLFAAWSLFLARLAGQTDVLVGSPVAGREQSECDDLIGFFVNTLPLRLDLSGRPTVGELLDRARDTVLDALEHQNLPFARLVEAVAPERSLSYAPLVQVTLAFQNAPLETASLGGAEIRDLEVLESGKSDQELTLSLEPLPDGGLRGILIYNTDVLDDTTIERWVESFESLVAGLARDEFRYAADLPLLSGEQARLVLTEWNDNRRARPSTTIDALCRAQAARTPDAVALVHGDTALSFAGLEHRATGLAALLRGRGIGPDRRVGVAAERSVDLVVAIRAVLEAGGAYVPLDPAYPQERLLYLIEDAVVVDGEPGVVLRQHGLETILPERPEAFEALELEGMIASSLAAESIDGVRPDPENLAYLIYTSGSTGRPKGVAIPHRSAVELLAWASEAFPAEERRGMLAATSINFDLSIFEIFLPLAYGGTILLGRNALDLAASSGRRENFRTVTLVNTVPSAMAELLDLGGLPPSVRTVNLAGEPLREPLVARLYQEDGVRRVVDLYGPSEDTTYSTYGPRRAGGRETIGVPLSNTSAYVVDRWLGAAPLGVAGELCLGGRGLARGYLARPTLTAEKFIPDPFLGEGARMYRTGDLVRYFTDGKLQFLGRIDHQVKVRGFRIELGEIEVRLLEHPRVREAVVLVERPNSSDARLIGYVVPLDLDGAIDAQDAVEIVELQEHLGETLPAYMVPSAFAVLDEMPRLPNGKIDRKALARLEVRGAKAKAASYEAPRTDLEIRLASVWSDLLGVERLGVQDHFFSLGGHSLLATQVVSRLQSELGLPLPVRAVFEAPTIAQLAELIQGVEPGAEGDAIERISLEGDLPLSFAQERLWFLHQLEPETAASFLIVDAVRLEGALDVGALERALERAAARHPSLRMRFGSRKGQPFLRVAKTEPFDLSVIDLTDSVEDESELLRRQLLDAAERPFDLENGPLWTARLLRFAPQTHVLAWVHHHIVSDGWSMGVFLRDVSLAYGAARQGVDPDWPSLPVTSVDVAAWQRRRLDSPEIAAQVEYWRGRLEGLEQGLDLPTDRPRRAVRRHVAGQRLQALGAGLSRDLKTLAGHEQATLFMVLLAAFGTLLQRLSGETRLAIGTPIAGRSRPEVEDVVGLFLNTLALRLDVDPQASFRDLIGVARSSALGAYAHQDVPFEKLLEAFRPERDLSRTPYFQVFLNMLNLPHAELSFEGGVGSEGLDAVPVDVPIPHAKFDWTVYVLERGDSLTLDWVYDADLYDEERMAEIGRQLESLLRQVVRTPDVSLARLSLLSEAARQVLVDPSRDLTLPWSGACHDQMVTRAQAHPERLAVDDGLARWTYGELETRSRHLAATLQASGIGRGDAVAIFAHRGAAVVGALFGVLRAGAAFVLLDPAYPPARLGETLDLSRPRAMVHLSAAGPIPTEVHGWVEAQAVPVLSDATGLIADPDARLDPVEILPTDTAYLAFTSGSTGRPKGILGRHGGLGQFVPALVDAFGFSSEDRFSMLSALAHDPLHRDILTPLQLGASLHVPEDSRLGEPGYLSGWMREQGIAVAHLTPSLARILTDAAQGDIEATQTVPSLRYALMVGEPLRRDDTVRLKRLAPNALCVNSYGSTETGRAVSYDPVRLEHAGGRDVLPLGQGLGDVQLLVMNRGGTLCGLGELGEVWIRSPHLTGGYLDDPAATASRFLPYPFGLEGERIYRTGDLGRYRLDGRVEFSGRADQQVKIRGFRVELGEIESILASHPSLREAAVAVRDGLGRRGENVLVAYIVPKGEERATVRALRVFLAERLPEYMIPTQVVELDALPLTANRKLDRTALPDPEPLDAFVAPRSDVEEILAMIWGELLELPEVGIHDNFFDLGGHSLHANRHMYRLQELLDVHLPVRTLFEAQTIEEMALMVEDHLLEAVEALDEASARQQLDALRRADLGDGEDGAGAACALVLGVPSPTALPEADDLATRRVRLSSAQQDLLGFRLRRVLDHSAYGQAIRGRQGTDQAPLSWFQEAFWFIEQREGAASVYRMWLENVLEGELDLPHLQNALADLIERQELLRTRFGVNDEGLSYQEILPDLDVHAPFVDLRALAPEDREGARSTVIDAMQAHPFDLWRPPLFRLVLAQTGDEEVHLLLTLHHIISDVWSVSILIRDLAELYNARVEERVPSLPELSIRFADYAAWERERIEGEALDRLMAYWGEKMAGGIPQLRLITDRPRPEVSSFQGTIAQIVLSEALTSALHQRSRDEEASLFMSLMTGYKLLLNHRAEEDDVLVATPMANRARMQAEELIGCFASMILLRTDLSGDPTLREVLARVRETTLGAFAHQDMPFFLLLANFAPPGYNFDSSPFQASFTLHNAPVPNASMTGLTVAPGELVDRGTADIDLALAVHEEDGKIHLVLRYDTDLFDASTAETMLEEMRAFCEVLAWRPDVRISGVFEEGRDIPGERA